jgi:hypothetical protein
VAKQFQDAELERRIGSLFALEEDRPCPVGTELLRAFAEARPMDFSFLEQKDLVDSRNPAFADIPEWEAFVGHYSTCKLCNV